MKSHHKTILSKYYIPFEPKAKVNYLLLFRLYDIAKYNNETKCRDTIKYTSVSALAEQLETSRSTLNRIFNNADYMPFITVNKAAKRITINNDIKGGKPFVCLNYSEVSALVAVYDNLLCRYFIYIKYYCGYAKSKDNDFTIKQFLAACGYSQNSSYEQKISEYNRILKEYEMIRIQPFIDEKGHKRNKYSIPS